MRQTATYGLNQWDEEDRILRTDFNADNAKVDAAMGALRSYTMEHDYLVKILDVTTTAAANQVNLYIGGVKWENYGEVVLYTRLKTKSSTGGTVITLDGAKGEYDYYNNSYNGYGTQNRLQYVNVYPQGTPFTMRIPYTRYGFVTDWSGVTDGGTTAMPLFGISHCYNTSKLRTQYANLNFTCNEPLDVGCRFVMMGVKL